MEIVVIELKELQDLIKKTIQDALEGYKKPSEPKYYSVLSRDIMEFQLKDIDDQLLTNVDQRPAVAKFSYSLRIHCWTKRIGNKNIIVVRDR